MHEAFSGEAGKPAAQETRHLRLIDLQDAGRTSLCKPACADGLANPNREIGLSEALLRIGQAEVCKNISAAFHRVNFLSHIACLCLNEYKRN